MAIVAVLLVGTQMSFAAVQQAGPHEEQNGAQIQREKMKALNFLVGTWSGPATIHGRNGVLKTTQTEDVTSLLDGMLLTVHGVSRDASGKIVFEAFATISYDEADGRYHFRAYNGGHYLDTELTVVDKGFSWSMETVPHITISNDMKLTPAEEWQETSTLHVPGREPMTTVQMQLKHVSK
ncbi:MAG: hypothetical protein JSS87_00800 [Acidobacteria bacterium]|nr:hypothetical protein [Acidobacteriota bacterium]